MLLRSFSVLQNHMTRYHTEAMNKHASYASLAPTVTYRCEIAYWSQWLGSSMWYIVRAVRIMIPWSTATLSKSRGGYGKRTSSIVSLILTLWRSSIIALRCQWKWKDPRMALWLNQEFFVGRLTKWNFNSEPTTDKHKMLYSRVESQSDGPVEDWWRIIFYSELSTDKQKML